MGGVVSRVQDRFVPCFLHAEDGFWIRSQYDRVTRTYTTTVEHSVTKDIVAEYRCNDWQKMQRRQRRGIALIRKINDIARLLW